MVVGVFIIAMSTALLVYWLRYSCVMLLRDAQERATVLSTEGEGSNAFLVLGRLKTETDLASLERSLERDYCVITSIIEHATDLELASIENKLLLLDYRMMRLWSRFTRVLAPRQSRQALSEMASVLHVLACQMSGTNQLRMEG
jgi:uncharacterized protein YjiS (DUF1127 family)